MIEQLRSHATVAIHLSWNDGSTGTGSAENTCSRFMDSRATMRGFQARCLCQCSYIVFHACSLPKLLKPTNKKKKVSFLALVLKSCFCTYSPTQSFLEGAVSAGTEALIAADRLNTQKELGLTTSRDVLGGPCSHTSRMARH